MAKPNLFPLTQVTTEFPMNQHHDLHSNRHSETLLARKNACIVCAICFTCAEYYGVNCHCSETQPRRGKNLPEGGLDSRAKKLIRSDKEDYEFTLKWLDEYAHQIYRDRNHNVVGLHSMTEVSLCKAHSSTLYRAKKKYHRNTNQAPPSPADSNGTLIDENHQPKSVVDFILPQPQPAPPITTSILPTYNGTLAAKVRELSFQYHHPQDHIMSSDFTMTTSTSTKRKRTSTFHNPPSSSISTPLFNQTSLFNTKPHHTTTNFSSQLPPLDLPLSANRTVIPLPYTKVIETVSLKSSPSINPELIYYVSNLAITDSFTFRDLLSEADIAGTPPPGKRIIISDGERTFPLGQAIRSVIRFPKDSHIEFYLGLSEKASIDWNSYK